MMLKADEARLYMLDLVEDFTLFDILNDTDFTKSTIYKAKQRLVDEKRLHHVGNKHAKSCKLMIYNRVWRTYDPELKGRPMTQTQQIIKYMLWLRCDFTVLDIEKDLGVSRAMAYDAKRWLVSQGLLFLVGKLTNQRTTLEVFSNKEREYEGVKKSKIALKPIPKIRPTFNPVDPLAGFARPI